MGSVNMCLPRVIAFVKKITNQNTNFWDFGVKFGIEIEN